jgi:L-amino acid N-acyltransferase YncA
MLNHLKDFHFVRDAHEDIRLRLANEEDVPQVIRIWKEGIKRSFQFTESSSDIPACLQASRLNQNTSPFQIWVATQAGNISGWISLAPISEHPLKKNLAAECSIYVDQSSQGKGIGQKLVQKMLESSRCTSLQHIYAHVSPFNTGCINLLEKNGFVSMGMLPQSGRHESPRSRCLLVIGV